MNISTITDFLTNIANDTLPRTGFVGFKPHPEVKELLTHHYLNHEIDCPLLTGIQVEFMGEIYNQTVEFPAFQPSAAELLVIRSINHILKSWVERTD